MNPAPLSALALSPQILSQKRLSSIVDSEKLRHLNFLNCLTRTIPIHRNLANSVKMVSRTLLIHNRHEVESRGEAGARRENVP